ncbi:MAG: hypothetical protein ACPLVJ_00760 [Candidatus Bathyarchaeales archaeon]
MRKHDNPVPKWITLVATLLLGCILVPIIVDQVQSVNTTSWSFTGVSGARTLFGLIPFIFIVGIIIYFMVELLRV